MTAAVEDRERITALAATLDEFVDLVVKNNTRIIDEYADTVGRNGVLTAELRVAHQDNSALADELAGIRAAITTAIDTINAALTNLSEQIGDGPKGRP